MTRNYMDEVHRAVSDSDRQRLIKRYFHELWGDNSANKENYGAHYDKAKWAALQYLLNKFGIGV